ncbi:uroporphyrinogen-III synthase [Companilactobacillus ginsenosidimutans]|uniref:Tetrapyrrole biosynthesis uroporphyrinogen III synthase domain-containing protein n=1 Tax=Companilactobacillus ginsenosidimutans TaxID=1007676 RepID=A0A0H4QE72_9LACO|nr:uroporphyrinogen-III synthase [Companilactobacillus ginsenosidimutans]AKP66232.1 hypothetical protein ABM34_00810 [Companilactobacillus ginsenosidimutans]
MATLITYPEDKFDEQMLAGLDKWSPLFLPLKRIEYQQWTKSDYKTIDQSDCIVVTSMLAIQALLKSDISTDKRVAVLSDKAAKLLRSFHFTNLIISDVENRQSLIKKLDDEFTSQNELVFLKSNLAADLFVNAHVNNILAYKNVWTDVDRDKALRKIGSSDFTKVLITSPSAFYRFEEIEEIIPMQFMSAKYYTLGPSTQKVMQSLGFDAYAPAHERNVLKQVVLKMTREGNING